MNSKILSHIKKVIVASAIITLCGTNATYAFSMQISENERTERIRSLFSRFFGTNTEETQEYNLEELQIDLEAMGESGNIDLNQITELIGKLPDDQNKDILTGIKDMFANIMGNVEGIDISTLLDDLLNTLMDAVGSLTGGSSTDGSLIGSLGSIIGGTTSSSLPVEAESINMEAKTAVEFVGEDYAANLHANVYIHVDENGNPDSDKWALLIHPFMLDGTSIAGNVGPFYYEKGYNIIAPDLRGFGDSEGSVALGCLESMDVYDWLVKLNDEYDVSQVIVHGISLGAATTNYLSGIDGFINNGPTKIETEIKPIRELNVIGLVEDCGYVDMTEFADKETVMSYSGLEEETFDYYSKATNSLKYCDLPMLIIHGTGDSTVDPENAETIKNTVKGDVEVWLVEGGSHAFIIMGNNADEYKEHVQAFIDKYENNVKEIKLEASYEAKVLYEDEAVEETVEEPKVEQNNDNDFINRMNKIKRLLGL